MKTIFLFGENLKTTTFNMHSYQIIYKNFGKYRRKLICRNNEFKIYSMRYIVYLTLQSTHSQTHLLPKVTLFFFLRSINWISETSHKSQTQPYTTPGSFLLLLSESQSCYIQFNQDSRGYAQHNKVFFNLILRITLNYTDFYKKYKSIYKFCFIKKHTFAAMFHIETISGLSVSLNALAEISYVFNFRQSVVRLIPSIWDISEILPLQTLAARKINSCSACSKVCTSGNARCK